MSTPTNLFAPLTKSIQLAVSPAQAFARFVERFGAWWPLADGHSVFGREAGTCRIEPQVGGRIVEVARDGREAEWGRVTQWSPPEGLSFAWYPGRDATSAQNVDVRFIANTNGTRVELVHHDWHLLGERAAESRDSYDRGWDHVLGTFGAHASRAAARSVYPMAPRGRVVAHSATIAASPERVFELLATAAGLDRWFTTSSDLEPCAGGRLVFRWRGLAQDGELLEFFGRVREWDAPHRFEFDWQADSGAYDLRCTMHLQPDGEGTRVQVRETGFRDDDIGLQDLLNRQGGWSQTITELKMFAEHGVRL